MSAYFHSITMAKKSLESRCRNAIFQIARTVEEINQGVKELDTKIDHIIKVYHSNHYTEKHSPSYDLNGEYLK